MADPFGKAFANKIKNLANKFETKKGAGGIASGFGLKSATEATARKDAQYYINRAELAWGGDIQGVDMTQILQELKTD